MSVIDIHTHAFPDAVAGRALAALTESGHMEAGEDGTIGALTASMDATDVDVSVVCPIATRPGQAKGILRWCKKIRSDRIEPFGSVHPGTDKPARWIERFHRAGLGGIKLHPMYQHFRPDDPVMDEIYAAATDCEMVVQFHCGRDVAFDPDDDRAAPQRIARVRERFGKLRILATHMGGWQMWDEAADVLAGSDVYLETSFSLDLMGAEKAVELLARYGGDRICFGSDWPWQRQQDGIEAVRKLALSEQQTKDILWGNAARLLGY